MLKKVQMTLQSTQYDPPKVNGGDERTPDPVSITQQISARWRETGDEISLSYEEHDPDGGGTVAVQIYFAKCDPNTVTISRSGAQKYALLFQENGRSVSEYSVAGLELELAIVTRRLCNRLAENGTLHLEYVIEVQGENSGLRIIDIRLDKSSDHIIREYK
jgi:uncharacterized beta-barrel protein YwiB (DUF1934 family)